MCVYIYIYIESERDCTYTCVCIYIYIATRGSKHLGSFSSYLAYKQMMRQFRDKLNSRRHCVHTLRIQTLWTKACQTFVLPQNVCMSAYADVRVGTRVCVWTHTSDSHRQDSYITNINTIHINVIIIIISIVIIIISSSSSCIYSRRPNAISKNPWVEEFQ